MAKYKEMSIQEEELWVVTMIRDAYYEGWKTRDDKVWEMPDVDKDWEASDSYVQVNRLEPIE